MCEVDTRRSEVDNRIYGPDPRVGLPTEVVRAQRPGSEGWSCTVSPSDIAGDARRGHYGKQSHMMSRPGCPGAHHSSYNTIAVRGEKCMCATPPPRRCESSPIGGESARASKRPKRCEPLLTAGVSFSLDAPTLPPRPASFPPSPSPARARARRGVDTMASAIRSWAARSFWATSADDELGLLQNIRQ